ncbi:TetR-like C-terminal domain-containing protein [Companilactobacillus mishanensis]|nr:TetR-like C-terminal domain-containing protein [Companilactobacillus mishanensis]
MSRSTIYYHFDCIEDIYLYLFENTVIRKVMLECTNYDEVIVSTIDYILANKILCLNLYHLTTLMNRQDYLLGILSASFHRFELPLNTPLLTENYLMGGFLFVMTTWLDGKMVTDKKIVIQQLHDYGNIVKTHLTI